MKNLQAEQIENKKAGIIMIFLLIIGIIFIVYASLIFKFFGFIPLSMGLKGFWTIFINSPNKVAVHIAKSWGRRSIYLEIEECKKNIEELERIMNEKIYQNK